MPQKPVTPAELAALEYAFASDPSSEAWRPLTEAYLSMGRFMEAMVVSKKGVKAHADDPSARLVLAAVYAAQGKDQKALEELEGLLSVHPEHVAANRMAGQLRLAQGDKEAGAAALLRAAEADPQDPETLEALRKWAIPPPAPWPPPVPPSVPVPVPAPPARPAAECPERVA